MRGLRSSEAEINTSGERGDPTSGSGPTLPTCALQQVVGYLRYTGRDANIVEEAALDPRLPVRHVCFEGKFPRITGRGMDAKSAEN